MVLDGTMVCVRVGGDDDDDCGSKGCAEVVSEREPDKATATTAKTKPAARSPFLLPPVELRQAAGRGIGTDHYLRSLSSTQLRLETTKCHIHSSTQSLLAANDSMANDS